MSIHKRTSEQIWFTNARNFTHESDKLVLPEFQQIKIIIVPVMNSSSRLLHHYHIEQINLDIFFKLLINL